MSHRNILDPGSCQATQLLWKLVWSADGCLCLLQKGISSHCYLLLPPAYAQMVLPEGSCSLLLAIRALYHLCKFREWSRSPSCAARSHKLPDSISAFNRNTVTPNILILGLGVGSPCSHKGHWAQLHCWQYSWLQLMWEWQTHYSLKRYQRTRSLITVSSWDVLLQQRENAELK